MEVEGARGSPTKKEQWSNWITDEARKNSQWGQLYSFSNSLVSSYTKSQYLVLISEEISKNHWGSADPNATMEAPSLNWMMMIVMLRGEETRTSLMEIIRHQV
jgi:hypothetical protein